MKELSIDIETYSSVDITKTGVYRYVEAKDFEVLLFAYSIDGGDVQIIDLASGEELPNKVVKAIFDDNVIKKAYNAQFERVALSKHFGKHLSPVSWHCTMVKAAMAGYPFGLDNVARVMKLDAQKDNKGKALIRYFSMPCRPTKTNGNRSRNLPEHDTEKWQQFKDYCVQDVVVEQAVAHRVRGLNITEEERNIYVVDQIINDRGVRCDIDFAKSAVAISERHKEYLLNETKNITNLDNPNSLAQLKDWLSEQSGTVVESITKKTIPLLLNSLADEALSVIQMRSELAKSSVSKFNSMLTAHCADGRLRGMFKHYGASRTGRASGSLTQMQNLPQNHLSHLDYAREFVKTQDLDSLEIGYSEPLPSILSQLIRTAFIPADNHEFIISDFSAIEARILAWISDEAWRLDAFKAGMDIYCASIEQIFVLPKGSVNKKDPRRQQGKIAELASGYGGGYNAYVQFGAKEGKNPLDDETIYDLVKRWREANPNIVKFWKDIESAAKKAIKQGVVTVLNHNIKVYVRGSTLVIELPSKRCLMYKDAHIGDNNFGIPVIKFKTQKGIGWVTVITWGGTLTENICQAIARDCLMLSVLRLEAAGHKVIIHVHDEVVVEAPIGSVSVEAIENIMAQPIEWAEGLLLPAEGFVSNYYRK